MFLDDDNYHQIQDMTFVNLDNMAKSVVMKHQLANNLVRLNIKEPIWDHVFTVAPLVVVGTKEGANYDLAPKHMATPIGLSNFFAFVCTPKHSTYHNVKKYGEFSISFPFPDQVVLTSLSASPRCDVQYIKKPIVKALPTIKCNEIDSIFFKDSYLFLECELFNIIDGFDDYSIIIGKIKEAKVDKEYLKISDKDEQQQIHDNPLLAYIAQGRFAKITDTFNFPFPKGFKK